MNSRATSGPGERIAFLEGRDGIETTIEWVRRTLSLYQQAVEDPGRYSSAHKERLRVELEYMAEWLEQRAEDAQEKP